MYRENSTILNYYQCIMMDDWQKVPELGAGGSDARLVQLLCLVRTVEREGRDVDVETLAPLGLHAESCPP